MRPSGPRQVQTGQGGGTGRRKEAIARVRISPGTGQWKINGRTLDDYFPNKVHQQLISEPFVTLGAEEQFDVVARITGGGVAADSVASVIGPCPMTRRAESPRPMPHTVRLPYMSFSVANSDAMTDQSLVPGLVTIGPTVIAVVVARIRE